MIKNINSNLSYGSYNPYYYDNYGRNSYRNYYEIEEPQENNQDIGNTAIKAGVLQLFALGLHKISEFCSTKLMQGKEFTTEQNVKTVAERMVKDNKLKVDIGFIDNNNVTKYTQKYGQALGKELDVVAAGKNAFYADKFKLAVAPKSKPSLILHELGHAINAHKGKFLKLLQKSRMIASAAPTVLLMLDGVFRREDNKPNFIERNAGILGFLSFLPTIAEEGIASIRGVKAAKNVLGKTVNIKALKRNYFFAWCTYLLAGIGLGIAAKLSFVQNRLERN